MNLDRIASLLASGIKPAQVATIIGVTPARISQLLSPETGSKELQNLIALKQASIEKEDIEESSISAKYTAAEHTLINQIIEMAPASELRDITAALRVVSERQEKMKARTLGTKAPASSVVQIVSVHLPSHALPTQDVTMTSQNEVIAIGEQTLAPLPATAVTNLFSEMKEKHYVKSSDNRSPEENASEAILPASSSLPSLGDFLQYATA